MYATSIHMSFNLVILYKVLDIFYCHTSLRKCVYLKVYADDIVILGDDVTRISQLKEHLISHFQTKDHAYLKYFLRIEVNNSKGVVFSEKIYTLDILEETRLANR